MLLKEIMMTDIQKYEGWMRRCIELAKVAGERDDPPVGSVIIKDDQIVGEGIEGGKTHQDITFHSEIEAIRMARKRLGTADLSDCILVTTHEPCIMCSYVIKHHRIRLLIMGLTTGKIGGYSSAFPVLLDTTIAKWGAPPKIIGEILEQECRDL